MFCFKNRGRIFLRKSSDPTASFGTVFKFLRYKKNFLQYFFFRENVTTKLEVRNNNSSNQIFQKILTVQIFFAPDLKYVKRLTNMPSVLFFE